MKQLKFSLTTNGEEVIKKTLNYFIKDEVIKFKDEDTYYEYDIQNKVFIKKHDETIITIEFDNKIMVVTLLSTNSSFDMDLISVSVKNTDNVVTLEYTFMSDEKTTNCIYIGY